MRGNARWTIKLGLNRKVYSLTPPALPSPQIETLKNSPFLKIFLIPDLSPSLEHLRFALSLPHIGFLVILAREFDYGWPKTHQSMLFSSCRCELWISKMVGWGSKREEAPVINSTNVFAVLGKFEEEEAWERIGFIQGKRLCSCFRGAQEEGRSLGLGTSHGEVMGRCWWWRWWWLLCQHHSFLVRLGHFGWCSRSFEDRNWGCQRGEIIVEPFLSDLVLICLWPWITVSDNR